MVEGQEGQVKIIVQLISASWCKRCQTIKPDLVRVCELAGATLTVLDYDQMEENDPIKIDVKSLPTIRFMGMVYTTDSFESCKADIMNSIAFNTDSEF